MTKMHVNCIIYIFVLSSFICKSLMQRVVSRCPENKASWREREAAWQCSQNPGYFYHCIGTLDDTLVETCLLPRSMSLNGQCPFIDLSAGSKFHIKVCPPDTRSECPHGDSTSNNLYKYPFCTNDWQFSGSSITTIKGGRLEATTKFKQHSSRHSIDDAHITLDASHTSYSTRYLKMITSHINEDKGEGFNLFTWPLLGAAAVILLLVIVVVKLICRLKQKSHQTHVVQGNKQDETPSSSNYASPIYHVYNEINEQATENGSSSSDSYLEPKSKETPNPYLIIKHSSYETLPKTTIESTVNIHVCKDGKGKKKSCSI